MKLFKFPALAGLSNENQLPSRRCLKQALKKKNKKILNSNLWQSFRI